MSLTHFADPQSSEMNRLTNAEAAVFADCSVMRRALDPDSRNDRRDPETSRLTIWDRMVLIVSTIGLAWDVEKNTSDVSVGTLESVVDGTKEFIEETLGATLLTT